MLLWETQGVAVKAGDVSIKGRSRLAAALGDLAACVAEDLPALGRNPATLKAEAADVLSTVAAGLAPWPEQMPLHQRLALGWKRPQAAEPIRKSLVLAAEHELNVSAFAARVTTSGCSAFCGDTFGPGDTYRPPARRRLA